MVDGEIAGGGVGDGGEGGEGRGLDPLEEGPSEFGVGGGDLLAERGEALSLRVRTHPPPLTARELQVNAVINNSFGFGGHNATIAAKKFVG